MRSCCSVPPVPSTGEHALLTSRCRVLAGQLEFLEAAQQPGLTRRRFRPASLARFRERERHVDVPRDARPAHDDGGRDRSRMSRTAVPCAPPRSAVCTRPLAAVDCETAVRQVAERARALTDAPCAHTQQVAGLLIGLRPHRLLLCSLERSPSASRAKAASRGQQEGQKAPVAAYCPS